MARCGAIKANGQRCGGVATERSEWCYQHDPTRSEERQRNAAKGGRRGGRGRSGGSAEVSEIRGLLRDLTSGVLDHRVNSGVASVIVQLSNARIRLIECERRLLETQDLESRIEVLEQRDGQRRGQRKAH